MGKIATPPSSHCGALDTIAAAEYTAYSPATLRRFRATGEGPAYVKVNKKVVYLVDDLDAWLHSHRVSA